MTLFKGDLQMHASKNNWDNNQPNADIIHITNQAGTRTFNVVTEYSQLSQNGLVSWVTLTSLERPSGPHRTTPTCIVVSRTRFSAGF